MEQKFTPGEYVTSKAERSTSIEILSVMDEFITGRIHSIESTFSKDKLKNGFVVGETLTFKLASESAWVILEPKTRPWYILGINTFGEKYFEHYR